jgi:hypothetical protein
MKKNVRQSAASAETIDACQNPPYKAAAMTTSRYRKLTLVRSR